MKRIRFHVMPARGALRFAILLSTALVGGIVTGCSQKLTIVLWNDSGEAVAVVIGGEELAIPPAKSREFDYPTSTQNFTVRLRTGACEALYLVPAGLPNYPHFPEYYGPVKAQIEADLSIHLAPTDAKGINAISSIASLQKDGFPIHPVAKSCRS